jgi:hypothetical protein
MLYTTKRFKKTDVLENREAEADKITDVLNDSPI